MRFFVLAAMYLLALQATAAITISGKVTDKLGQPVKKCDVFFNQQAWIDDNSVHVQCDANGNYSAQIEPGEYNSMYVCDEELYAKTKLEFWGWNLNLQESQTIDASFDTMEVYSLSTWASNGGSNSIFASFRPMNLAKGLAGKYKNTDYNGKTIAYFDIAPELDNNSIKGFIDDAPLTLVSMGWVYEKLTGCDKSIKNLDTSNGCYMPMVIAQFKKPKLSEGQHTLKIDITDSQNGDFGQGITHFTSNKKGLGF